MKSPTNQRASGAQATAAASVARRCIITHKDLAQLTEIQRPFSRPGWVFELKYDGFRCLVLKTDGAVRMLSRRGRSLNLHFPELVEELQSLPDGVAIDSELVVLDERGHPHFHQLSARALMTRPTSIVMAARKHPAAIFAFDLLMLDGRDQRRLPLLRRKALLERLLKGGKRIRYLHHIGENGERLYEQTLKLELEGIVCKRADSPYTAGRSTNWLKVKTPVARDREHRAGFVR